MAKTRKQLLLDFIEHIPENHYVALYYLDKLMEIMHYTIYSMSEPEVSMLKEKIMLCTNDLEDSITKIFMWKESESREYLTGVYDGMSKNIFDVEVIP